MIIHLLLLCRYYGVVLFDVDRFQEFIAVRYLFPTLFLTFSNIFISVGVESSHLTEMSTKNLRPAWHGAVPEARGRSHVRHSS